MSNSWVATQKVYSFRQYSPAGLRINSPGQYRYNRVFIVFNSAIQTPAPLFFFRPHVVH